MASLRHSLGVQRRFGLGHLLDQSSDRVPSGLVETSKIILLSFAS
jgi:hypothetical protein